MGAIATTYGKLVDADVSHLYVYVSPKWLASPDYSMSKVSNFPSFMTSPVTFVYSKEHIQKPIALTPGLLLSQSPADLFTHDPWETDQWKTLKHLTRKQEKSILKPMKLSGIPLCIVKNNAKCKTWLLTQSEARGPILSTRLVRSQLRLRNTQ